MIRIALLSDTHNHLSEIALKHLETVDCIWHAGDIATIAVCDELKKIKPLIAVYGNIDGQDIRKEYPKVQRFMCEGVEVLMTHIGGYPGKYTPEARGLIEQKVPRIFVCGHSHILRVMFDKGYNMLYLNPGAAGNYGIHKVKTLLKFCINGTEIKDMQVVEMGAV